MRSSPGVRSTPFSAIGLAEAESKNAAKNAKFRATLTEVIAEAGLNSGCDKSIGLLVYAVATKFPPNALAHR